MYNIIKFAPLAVLLFLISCGGRKTDKNAQATPKKTKVRVEEVKLMPVEQLQTFTATVEAETVNNISASIPSRIRRILVDVGTSVRKGQTLVQMDDANLSQQKTQLANLKRDYERFKELYEVGGISQQQLEQMKVQLDVANSAYGNLAENTILKSPINGVVTARNYDPGDIPAGLPVLTVESINSVKVMIKVSESFYTKVSKGMRVDVKADVFGDELFIGTVSLIHPTLDALSHTFPVEVRVANSNRRLRPGMFARVTMNFGASDHALIPDMAVMKQAGTNERYVFVETNGKAIYTKVELGRRVQDRYEIISGLTPGDRVVVYGNTNLVDGSEVEIVQ